jgi:uncharacterized protein with GYD domain
MTKFAMLGKYTMFGLKAISAKRSEKAIAIIGDCGGKLEAGYMLLGETDIVLLVDFPGVPEAMKASVELSKLLDIAFTTAPAMTVEEFDKLIPG